MCDLNKPLFQCTLGDFIEAIREAGNIQEKEAPSKYLRGMKAIMEIFSCSDYRARQIKNSHVIDGAITYLGERTFVVNPELAVQLYNKSKSQ